MTFRNWTLALLAGSALVAVPAAAHKTGKPHHHHGKAHKASAAGEPSLRSTVAAQQAKIDELTARLNAMQSAPAAPAAPVDTAAADEAAANSEFLKAQVDALQAQLEGVKKTVALANPVYKGAPEWTGSDGFKFKMNGEVQYDAGYIENPKNAVNTPNLGFNGRSRRLLLGIEGTILGDFAYKAQFNFAQGIVAYEDVVLEYSPKGSPLTLTIGNFYPFSSLDNMTSNRFVSVIERSQLNDGFNNDRRIGVGLTYANKAQDFRIQGGIFNQTINNNFNNTGWQGSVRVVYSPQMWGGQLHLAGSFQHRENQRDALNQTFQARPFSATTDQRFVSTGAIASKRDNIYGVEVLGIFGPLHVQGEAQLLKVDAIRPTDVLTGGEITAGTRYLLDPSFYSVYGELGYWLTGETRGYKNGKIDRTKILHPVTAGGMGGFDLVGRIDYIDFTDRVTSVTTPTNNGLLNGGTQTGYIAALNWWPIDYVRFTAEYIHAEIKGGPRAINVIPVSGAFPSSRSYSTNGAVIRAQIDF